MSTRHANLDTAGARRCARAALCALLLGGATAAGAGTAAPLVGSWKMTLSDGICSEIHRFDAYGGSVVVSGAARVEGTYGVSAKPDPHGFYKLDEQVVHGNGKPDCTGAVAREGNTATIYVKVHPKQNQLLFCDTPAPDSCVGPLERVADEAPAP